MGDSYKKFNYVQWLYKNAVVDQIFAKSECFLQDTINATERENKNQLNWRDCPQSRNHGERGKIVDPF